MTAYYNEHDPFAAAWLRVLIEAGHIAPGVVDERSVEDVVPADLIEFTQCHFFAGIGVWSYALRQAGWPDDKPVWTGSCPCQPFSSAGKGKGFDDERHLWPAFYHLIDQCRPAIVFGEQVASKDADDWIDLVHADLEAVGYAFGCVPFPSAGVGAPHIRDRNYWAADAEGERQREEGFGSRQPPQRTGYRGESSGMGNNSSKGLERFGSGHKAPSGRVGEVRPVTEAGESGGMVKSPSDRFAGARTCGTLETRSSNGRDEEGSTADESRKLSAGLERPSVEQSGRESTTRPTNGQWRDADWLFCRDGKWRPVEPGTFPLANGAAARVGRLRGYGNAINAQAAIAFIEAYLG